MTAGWAPSVPVTFTASEDLTRYRFVKFGTGANVVDAVDSQGEAAIGVVVESVVQATADGASVWLLTRGGILPIEASAAIAQGAQVTASANGRGETAATGDVVLGHAVEAASGAGHVIGIVPEFAERLVP